MLFDTKIIFLPSHSLSFPVALYHMTYYVFVPCSRFVSTVLQFQLHEALCLTAGQYAPNDPRRPMYRCDIYNDHKAGAMLG